MREATSPYRAALGQGRRRAVVLILAVTVALFGAIAWTSYRPLRQQRGFLDVLESGKITSENFFQFAPGITCEGGDFGPKIGPAPSPAGEVIEPTCQFVGPDGTPIGEPFTGDPFGPKGPEFSEEVINRIRPQLIEGQRRTLERTELSLAPRHVFESRIRALGVFLGIGLMVLLGATFFGAEVRWGVWPTLLTHEPRRGRVLASKLAALWTLVLIGFALTLGVVAGVDAVMRVVTDVDATGGPGVVRLAKEAGWAVLSLELYATMAAALALTIRTSIAGAAALLLALGDHLIVEKYKWLRHFLPTQQIATLLPQPTDVASGYAWFPRLVASIDCTPPPPGSGGDFFSECREIILKPPPNWRASLVIVGWTIGFALLAWVALRARDVPQ